MTTECILLNKLRTISQQTALSAVILEKLINYLFRNFHPFITFFALLEQPTILSYPEPVEITQQYNFFFSSSPGDLLSHLCYGVLTIVTEHCCLLRYDTV